MNLDNGKPSFLKYDKTKGAPDNSIFGIADDKSGNIWVSTNRGIGKFDPKTEKFKSYNESDGLQSNSFIWDASFQSIDGEIFFGGSIGLNSFYPDSIIDNIKLPVVYISKLMVNNKVINVREKFDNRIILEKNIRYTSEITLTSNESVFSLEFIAMDNVSQDEVLYAYQLEGFDKDWIYVNADKRTVDYTNLDDGTYFFKVKASNSDGFWNEKPVILKITILPPWWKTYWAYLLYLLVFALLLFFFRRLALIRAKLKNELVIEHINRVKDEELHQSKLKFFTNISHEFRTPLTLILGPLERIMATGQGDNLMKRQFLMIKRNADRLNLLIDQLMDFRKIDNGLMTLDAAEGDICKFICDISLLFEGSAIEKNISLSIKCSGNNFNVWFDRDKMEKIIYNLLSNAFKFTPDNGIIVINVSFISGSQVSHNSAINLNESAKGSINQYVEISVEDSGIGIPASNIEHVFERFYKGGNSEIIAQKGTGIGLALTKDFVELHGGEIFVKSDEGKGSCFTFWLPKGDNGNRKVQYTTHDSLQLNAETIIWDGHNNIKNNDFETGSESAPARIKGKAPLILVVDDDSEIVKFIGDSLNSKYKIIDAENGLQGLQSAVENNPDLIISDVMMPEMDGIEFCQKLKTNLKVSHIPVILLTAKTALESRIEGIETGADAYLSKPFSIKLLEAQVNNLLANRKKLREEFSKKITVEPSEITITSTDEKFIKKAILLVEEHIGDPEFSVEQLGSSLGLSRSHLHRKLVAITSQPATEFIRTIRLKRSAQLLVQSKLTVEEITYKVGFNSPSYFTKCFRLHFGMTPSEYIENSQLS
jgi:signal transduction histidine kinase/DNA-binding response OmpR family regulator